MRFRLLALSMCFLLISCAAKRSRGFSLDDYKTGKAAEEKLQSMFPKGTNVEEFTKFMKELGVECNVGKDTKGQGYASCYTSTEFVLFQEIQWGIFADIDNQKKITRIEIGRNYSTL